MSNLTHHTFTPWRTKGDSRVVASESAWKQPLKWNQAAACLRTFDCANGDHADCCPQKNRPRVAVACEVFEDWQGGEGAMSCRRTGEELVVNKAGHIWPAGWPSMSDGDDWGVRTYTMDDVRRRLFALIDATPNLDWLVTTRYPENVAKMCAHRTENLCVREHSELPEVGR